MGNQKYNIHGIISIVLFLISFGIGVVSVSLQTLILGIFYLLLIVLAFIVTAIFYCSKCLCRDHCNHIFIGKISILFSKKKAISYNVFDIILGITPMIAAIVFPQFWLIQNPIMFVSFWCFLIIAGLEVYFYVCNKCRNFNCKMCRNKIIILKNE